MKLQYQLSNADWVDCGDRTEKFLGEAMAFGKISKEDVIAALADCKTVRIGTDWYDLIRDAEAIEARIAERKAKARPVEMVKCRCGHTVPKTLVMSASLGTSCPDCYDRMSN